MNEEPVNPVRQLTPPYELTSEEIATRHRADAASGVCRSQPFMLDNKHLAPLQELLKKMVQELI